MSSYNELIALINGCINRNGVQAITGRVLNGVLRAMVNQLGAGYTMGGVAHPTDDPGTPEAPVCYYASEVGTYTHFGNIQIVPGELALLCFDLTDGWFKETMYEGFESVQATIDGNVGTPAVNVTYVNGVLSFDFSNMKGNTGAAAGFGNVTAAVDGTSGTPGVSVQTDGPDTAKNIAFQFTGLKGETGVTSVIATVDNTSGTPQCAVSLNGQQLTLAFTGLKGAQGDTGSSVAYPFTIVNNLTTNDATQALSAAMGVQLESEVSQLEAKVDYGNGILSIINGGWNIEGEKAVSCEKVVSLMGRTRVFFMTDRPNTPGYHYEYYGMQYNVKSGDTADYRRDSSVRVTNSNFTLKGNIVQSLKTNNFIPDNGALGFVFSIIERNEQGTINTALSTTSFNGYQVWLEFANESDKTIVKDAYGQDAVTRNLDRMSMLKSACDWSGTSGAKPSPEFLIITDPHRTEKTIADAIDMTNGFITLEAALCCGDIVGSYFREANSFVPTYDALIGKCNKPVLTVIGNHDTGYFNAISACGDHKEMYDSFIKPMVDRGWLANGEYQANKPYWYHDFTSLKIRVIGLYEYDCPLDLDDTNWDAVPYDSSKPNVALSTAYSIGDIVNCDGYTDYSFQCKNNLTTPNVWTDTNFLFPSYKLMRGVRLIRQEEAQWFLDTLYNTPANYTIVVLMHEPFSALASNVRTLKFAQDRNYNGGNGYMATDFIANAVNAYMNKQNYTEKVKMATTGMSAAAYLNTEGEEGDKYYYQVSKDFTSRPNSAFRCYIGGHIHKDLIFKHSNYPQYQIDVAATKTDGGCDITTYDNENDLCTETITVVAVTRASAKVTLVKLGANVTKEMTYRDMEKIDMSQ